MQGYLADACKKPRDIRVYVWALYQYSNLLHEIFGEQRTFRETLSLITHQAMWYSLRY